MSPIQVPDEVPESDAAEQSRELHQQVPDEEASVVGPTEPSMDAAPSDWQEQTEIVDIDPDEDDLGRRDE